MNMKSQLIGAICVILAGFAAPEAMAQGCNSAPLHLHIRPDSIFMMPNSPKCIAGNSFNITIMVTPSSAYPLVKDSVYVEQKESASGYTISGSNSDAANPEKLTATISGTCPGGLCAYDITAKGHGTLDPRGEIINSASLQAIIEGVLDDLGAEFVDPPNIRIKEK